MDSYDLDLLDDIDLVEPDYSTPPAGPTPSPELFKVSDTRSFPWRWVCKVFVRYERAGLSTPVAPATITGLWFAGSGVLISRCHVLTAGHVIRAVQGTARFKPVQVLVVPGQIPAAALEASAPFGVWSGQPSKTSVPESLFDAKQDIARLFDYGLIQLERKGLKHLGHLKVGTQTFGWFGSNTGDSLKQFNDLYGVTIARRRVNVAGYPMIGGSDRQMYRGYNDIDAVRPSVRPGGPQVPLLRYRIKTVSGISGGPVWLYDAARKNRQLIAVHSGNQSGMGWGVLLRSTVIRFLQSSGVPASDLRIT